MITETSSVLFSCTVEKIGLDGSAISRSVLVTPTSLLVCLLSGAVAQTISLSAVVMLELLEKRSVNSRSRCIVHLHGGSVSTFSFMNQEDIEQFVNVVSHAAGGAQVVRHGEKTVGKKRDNQNISSLTPKTVHFADHLNQTDLSQLSAASAAEPPNTHTVTTPLEPLETVPLAKKNELKTEDRREQVECSTVQTKQHTSPSRNNRAYSYVWNSPDHPSASVHMEGVSPVNISSPSSGLCNPELQSLEEQGHQDTSIKELCAQRDDAIDLQKRLSSELLSCEKTVSRLTDELGKKNALIEELKVALSSQESAFQEMVKATEKMRFIEPIKADLEKRVVLLEAEVRHLEELLNQKNMDHQQELAIKLATLHEANKRKVDLVHNAFAHDVEQMQVYVDNILKEKEFEARKWSEQERFFKAQIERQSKEISELKKTCELHHCVKSLGSSFLEGNSALSPLCREGGARMSSCQSPLPGSRASTSRIGSTLSTDKHAYGLIREKLQRYLDKQS